MSETKSSKIFSESLRFFFGTFFKNQSTGGLILLICTIIALIVANVPSLRFLQDYLHNIAGINIGTFSIQMSLVDWVNDGLMVIFFFVVGLEIKREMLVGELSSIKQATLPIFAALGGMIFPALIYTLFNAGTDAAHGWGIPMATDIAFAVGVISILGKRCPSSLKVFLMALAIADDLGAIVVLAIFYPAHAINFTFLILAAVIFAILMLFNKLRVQSPYAYLIFGLVMWYFIYRSGIHATIAGVLLAISIPSKTSINEVRFYVRMKLLIDKFKEVGNSEVDVFANPQQMELISLMNRKVDKINPLIHRFETVLHPITTFIIIPLFALTNAGVTFNAELFAAKPISPVALGIFFGLLLGKPIGITFFSWLSVKLKIAELPAGTKWIQILALGVVAGIGFTMSIFIDNLAFRDDYYVHIGKAAILITSFVAAILGLLAILLTTSPVPSTKQKKQKHN